jgi:hypothetical protein
MDNPTKYSDEARIISSGWIGPGRDREPYETYCCTISFTDGLNLNEAYFQAHKFYSDNRVGFADIAVKPKKGKANPLEFYRGSSFEKWMGGLILTEADNLKKIGGLKLEGHVASEEEVGRIISKERAKKLVLVPDSNVVPGLFNDIDSILQWSTQLYMDDNFRERVRKGIPKMLFDLRSDGLLYF